MHKRKLVVINNIPTPYRAAMFNKMVEIGARSGFEVEIFYQSASDKDRRHWELCDIDLWHPYVISRNIFGMHRMRFSYFQLNSDLLLRLLKSHASHVMYSPVGSFMGWWVGLFVSRNTMKIGWIESNMTSTRRSGFFLRRFKGFLLKSSNVYACPGVRAVEYLNYFLGKDIKSLVIRLPNVVDDTVYRNRAQAYRVNLFSNRVLLDLPTDKVVLLCIGDVNERKGVDQLLRAVCRVKGDYLLVFLGDGDVSKWAGFAEENGCSDRVSFRGFCGASQISQYLGVADFFVHAARKDPSPLSCIEALAAGLPIVVSEQTGNQPELVESGLNGFSFDVNSIESVCEILRKLLKIPPAERTVMGERSARLFNERFSSDVVLEQFFSHLNTTEPSATCV